jgi:signal peptidase
MEDTMDRFITWTRRVVALMIGLALFVLTATICLSFGAQLSGREALVIRGASMQPAIPLGAVVVVERVDPGTVRVGDVVSVRGENEVVYTHRVSALGELDGQRAFQTRGDANTTPEPALVPATKVIGRVVLAVPAIGFLVALVGTSSGIASLGCGLCSLLLSYWLFEDIELEQRELKRGKQPAPQPVPAS